MQHLSSFVFLVEKGHIIVGCFREFYMIISYFKRWPLIPGVLSCWEAVRTLAPVFFVMCLRVLLLTEIPPLLGCVSLTFISSRPRSEQSLVRWATPQLHDIDALARMVDPALKGIYPAKSLSRFADIVALCVQASLS